MVGIFSQQAANVRNQTVEPDICPAGKICEQVGIMTQEIKEFVFWGAMNEYWGHSLKIVVVGK